MADHELQRGKQLSEMSESVDELIEHVIVDCELGGIVIAPTTDARTTIDAEVECDADDPLPTVSWTVDAGTLRVDVHVPESTGRGYVRLRIGALRAASVQVTSQIGSIEVEDRSAAVDLRTRAGSIRAANIEGDVTLRTTAGAIKATDVRGESILIETHAGSIVADGLDVEYARVAGQVGRVNASFVTAPRRVEAITTVGKLTIAVPRGAYDITSSGRVRTDQGITTSASASEHRLDISVTVGTARIAASDA